MNFYVMTLFPEMVSEGLHTSIMGRAMDAGIIRLETVNIRDYTLDKHRHTDDYPYGGGAGMVMSPEPIKRCYDAIMEKRNSEKKPRVIYLTPWGKVFDQNMAKELAEEEDLIFLCGHYEGVDERVLNEIVTDPVSIGDYVLSGGELPAMVMIDAISRMVPGVLSNEESGMTESFENSLLEYPQYTRPEVWMEQKVPEVLLSGNHQKIAEWREERSIDRTLQYRPELMDKAVLSKKGGKYYRLRQKEADGQEKE